MKPIYTARVRPSERLALALDTVFGTDQSLFPTLQKDRRSTQLTAVSAACGLDGFDTQFATQGFGLFDPTRKVEASDWIYAEFERIDLAAQVMTALQKAADTLNPVEVDLPIEVYIIPLNGAYQAGMLRAFGLSTMGGGGRLMMTLWPSAGNLARLPHRLAWELARAARFTLHPEGETLRDWLVTVGLASHGVAATYPDLSAPWIAPFVMPADWTQALQHAAQLHGAPDYAALVGNVYGHKIKGINLAPQPAPLDDDEREYSLEVIRSALDETIPQRIAGYLYGDVFITEQGHPGVGMSPYAGLEVAHVLMGEALSRLGLTLGQALLLPSNALI